VSRPEQKGRARLLESIGLADTRPSLLCAPHMNTRYAALQENQQISCHKTL